MGKRVVVLIILCVWGFVGCGFIDFTPKRVNVADFQFRFESKNHPTHSELKNRLVEPVADRFEPWLGEGAERRLLKDRPLPPDTKIIVEVSKNKPKPPYYTVRKAGWTYPLDSTGIWREKLFGEGGGQYELEHHFVCKIWEKQGKIDKCNARNYDEGESIKWRENNLDD